MYQDNNHIIDELLVMYLLNEANTEQRQQVETWISKSSLNERYFNHFNLIWTESKKVDIPAGINEQEARTRLQKRISEPKKLAVTRRLNAGFPWLKIASLFVIVSSLVAVSLYLVNSRRQSLTVGSSLQPVTTTLPDGSIVTLNRHSEISYNSSLAGDERRLQLKGEAFFEVLPDKNKPFVIDVNKVEVRVLGTSFNIRSEGSRTEVIVKEGLVQVSRNGESVDLGANEKLVVEEGLEFSRGKQTDQLYNYYQSKQFICNNTPLWKLVQKLNEAYDSEIVIERPELANLPLTATFNNEPLKNILSIISETFEITVSREGKKIILK